VSDKRLFLISTCPDCGGNPHWPRRDEANKAYVYQLCRSCNGTGEIREEVKTTSDDVEDISRSWAESIGGVPDEGSGGSLLFFRGKKPDQLAFDLFPRADEWGVTLYSGGAKVCFWPRPMVTRGDLRRLCEAMGVTLKEGGS
jgi:hypothetical protein